MVAIDGTGDTDNIQDGINMLNNGVGEVYIKEGSYYVDTSISLGAEQTLRGAGYATHINTDQDLPVISSSGNNVIIENLRITGNDTGSSQDAINLTGNNCFIKNVWIDNMGANGISLTGSRSEISGCNISDCDANGILLNAADLSSIWGCEITTCDNAGIYLATSALYNLITGCNIHNNGDAGAGDCGLEIGGTSTQNVVTGNSIRDQAGVNETGVIIGANADENIINANVLGNNTTNLTDDGTDNITTDNVLS